MHHLPFLRRVPRARARHLSIAVVIAVLAGIAATTAIGSSQQKLTGPASWTMRFQQDWPTFDAYVDAGRNLSWSTTSPAYDRLISLGPKGAADKFQPYLASSWKVTPKSVQFKLRSGAKCTDGHVLTPVDVLNSIKRFIFVTKRNGSVAANSMGGFGPGPYHLHASNAKKTLSLSVDSPFRGLLSAFADFPIICPAGLEAVAKDPRALETQMYGSGPYTLVEAVHGDHITFKLRPEWNWGPPGTSTKYMPQTLVYKILTDETTAANAVLTGSVDAASVTGADVDRLAGAPNLSHQVVNNYNVLSFNMNQKPGSFLADKPEARRAIMAVIDRQKFNQAAFNGTATVVYGPFRPGQDCYDASVKSSAPATGLDSAKKILTDGGWTFAGGKWTKGGVTLKVRLVSTPLLNAGSDYLYAALQSLGIEVDFRNLVGSAYGAAYVGADFDVAPSRGSYPLADPGGGNVSWTGDPPPKGANYTYSGQQDPTYVKFWKAGQQNVGPGGCRYFTAATKLMLKNAYAMPLVGWNYDLFAKKGVFMPKLTPDGAQFPVYYINWPGK